MAKRSGPFTRRGLVRWLPWASAAVFIAGLVSVTIVFFGNTAKPLPEVKTPKLPPAPVERVQKKVPLDPKAREVAGKFILTAVSRENLRAAWPLAGPEIRQGMTLKEWLKGDIAVPYYPAHAIDKAPMRIDESYADEAQISVQLLPKDGVDVRPAQFTIVLRALGKGKNRRWVVDYFLADTLPPFPDDAHTR